MTSLLLLKELRLAENPIPYKKNSSVDGTLVISTAGNKSTAIQNVQLQIIVPQKK